MGHNGSGNAVPRQAEVIARRGASDAAEVRRLLYVVGGAGWDSPDGRGLLLIFEDKCQSWAPAIDRYCGLPAGTTDPATLLSVAWEVLNRYGERVLAADSPWAYVWHTVRNAAAIDAAGAALQTAALPAQNMLRCRSLPTPVRLGLDHDVLPSRSPARDLAHGPGTTDRWSPALHALLDLVVARGGDRAFWADVLDRAVEVMADARRSYEERELHRDPYLRLELGLGAEQLSALGALLIGTRRGDRASQSLLLALHRDTAIDAAGVTGSAERLRVLLAAETRAASTIHASSISQRGAA